jgi:hypothetical protein
VRASSQREAPSAHHLNGGAPRHALRPHRPPSSRRPAGSDPNHVVTFGFFDGTLDELNASQDAHGHDAQRRAADPYVAELMVNGVYDVVVDLHLDHAAT